jgi:hypothetical protein
MLAIAWGLEERAGWMYTRQGVACCAVIVMPCGERSTMKTIQYVFDLINTICIFIDSSGYWPSFAWSYEPGNEIASVLPLLDRYALCVTDFSHQPLPIRAGFARLWFDNRLMINLRFRAADYGLDALGKRHVSAVLWLLWGPTTQNETSFYCFYIQYSGIHLTAIGDERSGSEPCVFPTHEDEKKPCWAGFYVFEGDFTKPFSPG